MGAHDQWTQSCGEIVGDSLFQWVTVEGYNSNGSCPLVVCLVNMFVKKRMVEEPGGEKRERRG